MGLPETSSAPAESSSTPAIAPDTAAAAAASPTANAAAATAPAGKTAGTAPTPGAEGEVTPPAEYTPNLKFKVMDKEHEFAPYLKDVVKDAKTEKELRELYEKAYGLDVVKPKFTKMKEDFTGLQGQHQAIVGGLNELREMYQRNDMDGFFAKLQIPHEKILQYVVDKINYSELPPDQRQVLDSKRQAEQRAHQLEKQAGSYEQQHIEMLANAKSQILDMTLQKGDVTAFAKIFQEKTGGSFRNKVIDYAEAVFYTRKDVNGRPVDLTPEQAVKEVMEHYSPFVTQAQAAQTGAEGVPGSVGHRAPPVIPNVSGRQSSPTGTNSFKSTDDLRKHYREKFQSGE